MLTAAKATKRGRESAASFTRRRLAIQTVVLCGVQTPNCIRATAVDALGLDYRVTVLSDATASKSKEVQDGNLEGESSALVLV